MSLELLGMIQLGLLCIAIFVGFPTAITLLALGFFFGWAGFGWERVSNLMVSRAFFVMSNDVLIPVAIFIFMGYVVERSGILDRLFKSIQVATGPIRGSLYLSVLLTCTIFAAATGIIGASVTIMGLLAMPAMMKAKYDTRMSAGVITGGGCLGILIPPSVLLILYGATAGVSTVQLYAGAIIPGLILSGLYFLYIMVRVNLKPSLGPPLPKEERDFPVKVILRMLATSVFPIALLIFFVLGSIVSGWAAPTEASACGAAGALIIAAFYKKLNLGMLKESIREAIRTSSMVLFLMVGSSLFASVFALLGGSKVIESFVLALNLSPAGFIWLTMLIIFLLGWPLEWTEIIIIFLPLFLPLLSHFNVDPLWFGIMVAVNLQTAFLSPPVAMAAFYLKGVSPPNVTLIDIYWGMGYFMVLQVVGLLIVFFFPEVALWLPKVVFG
ncbi:MAG: TRAP transporter large permease subunit [Thermodesulfobacteriota bacterium]|nr:TRAP transporter large permease subunit [Thermodesulfobacteriota bacterium]